MHTLDCQGYIYIYIPVVYLTPSSGCRVSLMFRDTFPFVLEPGKGGISKGCQGQVGALGFFAWSTEHRKMQAAAAETSDSDRLGGCRHASWLSLIHPSGSRGPRQRPRRTLPCPSRSWSRLAVRPLHWQQQFVATLAWTVSLAQIYRCSTSLLQEPTLPCVDCLRKSAYRVVADGVAVASVFLHKGFHSSRVREARATLYIWP